MKTPTGLLTATLLLSPSLLAGTTEANCVFTKDAVSESKFRNDKGVARYTWNRKSNEARIVTNTGDLISIKYWACDHYGAHAVMLSGPYPADSGGDVNKKFIQLAEHALGASEVKTVRGYVTKHRLSLSSDSAQIDIPNTGYSEFFLRYSVRHDSVVFEIKFYQD